MYAPTRGAVPFLIEMRTWSSFCGSRAASIDCTRTTMRSVRSRSSRTSTKPEMATLPAERARTGCDTGMVVNVATAKPPAIAVQASATGRTMGRARASTAMAQQIAASPEPAHQAGSCPAVK
jgi:hypothetical protein